MHRTLTTQANFASMRDHLGTANLRVAVVRRGDQGARPHWAHRRVDRSCIVATVDPVPAAHQAEHNPFGPQVAFGADHRPCAAADNGWECLRHSHSQIRQLDRDVVPALPRADICGPRPFGAS